ncbi:MAG: prepilin-type N-terminal cleavage/methylation domain-containing protein [Acidimicrobiia bacterium]|nr:prepilin-type N-terminal cleavage/methylation domain-containing protein [Acidimicrobiia bacterium]
MSSREHEAGWTLVELLVVLAILAILVGLALPSLLGIRHKSFDMQVKMELTNSARAAAAIEVELDRYPADPAWLSAAMPELDFSGVGSRSIHLLAGDVGSSQNAQVLLYSRSVSGAWFGLRLVRSGPEAGRHTCKGAVTDMTLETCTGVAW